MKLPIRTLLLLSFLLLTRTAVSQQVWHGGIHMGTGYYQLYNKSDWNADPVLIYPVKSSADNWTIGATTAYTWGKHSGLSSGLFYSKNRQEFLKEPDPIGMNPDPLDYYSITNEFHYLKLPIKFQYSTNNQARHQFLAAAGVQASFLMDYREHFLQTSTGFRSEYEWHNKKGTALSPNNGDDSFDRFLYRRLLAGLSGELAYRLKLPDGWLFTLGVKGEYDLSNAENRKAKNVETGGYWWSSGIKRYGYGGPVENRPKTHNRAVGLFFSASIPLDIW